MHTTIVAFDISGFGKADRTDQIQLRLRRELYQVLEEAFAMTAIVWRDCYVEDRGDGVMVIAPQDVGTEFVSGPACPPSHRGLAAR